MFKRESFRYINVDNKSLRFKNPPAIPPGRTQDVIKFNNGNFAIRMTGEIKFNLHESHPLNPAHADGNEAIASTESGDYYIHNCSGVIYIIDITETVEKRKLSRKCVKNVHLHQIPDLPEISDVKEILFNYKKAPGRISCYRQVDSVDPFTAYSEIIKKSLHNGKSEFPKISPLKKILFPGQ